MIIKESDLYDPLKQYLQHQGYTIGGEVHECDLVALKEDEMVIVELKTRVSVDLLIQAARRKDISDSVYIAVPLPPGKKNLPKARGLKNLLRKLEVGLILVRFMKTKIKVEIVLHPQPYEKRMRRRKQAAILREVDGRYGEFHKGGIPTTEERISAYKQEAIRIAFLLSEKGDSSPRALKSWSARPDKVQPILAQNHYGWFDRVSRGLYRINPAGTQALDRYERQQPELMALFREKAD
ncbi:DUF2161 family putative PD-(D/E)XK-type phosphodiesterase [Oceanispirochaeta sp.]|jgi:hypothetical protein|uniref:DUF2161 family putative PD-(D/E)XK-type phosphodiesterase n=1 Tax=Oceanispirochaeta sp. TaxID=2035350 RepID=UPI002617C0E8|nr:DUF2161 family putative PD-(D/E)XK-type phosphodiesterase [Oceanispirochaeta sp.]MDA3958787.1 DUF2161 family putative PD-(D/E)XK-type phosphodiesterase [Oceanispirochaeta sp.]